MVGGGGPPTVSVPAPESMMVRPVVVSPLAFPFKDGKLPVYPEKFPVPLVTVADPVPELDVPKITAAGIETFPFKVPPVRVMVYGTTTGSEFKLVMESVADMVPVPMLVSVTLPEKVKEVLVPENGGDVRLAVNVVLVLVAAKAEAATAPPAINN